MDNQKKQILYAVIHDHILTASPVSSQQVSNKRKVDYSPATIRNVMAELEKMGFLKRSHISSGRIPTETGYRFYVDELMQIHPLSTREKRDIEQSLDQSDLEIEKMVQKACKNVSLYADQISFGIFPERQKQSLKHIQFLQMKEKLVLVIWVRSSGLVENKIVELPETLTQADLNHMHNYLNEQFAGLTPIEIHTKILEELQKDQIRYNNLLTHALLISQKSLNHPDPDLHIEGQSKLFHSPEFADLETMERLIKTIEQKTKLLRLLKEAEQKPGVRVIIGDEIEASEINGLTFITSTYNDAEGNQGYLGVLGPTRMNYAKIMPLVEFTTRLMTQKILEKR